MINKLENEKINKDLKELYSKYTFEFLKEWKECYGQEPPSRMNEFGIIDVEKYDAENGILVIGRETNGVEGWFENNSDNDLFINWMHYISVEKCGLPKRPNIWYNTARYIMTVRGEKEKSLTCDNKDLIPELGTMAFTNINKVGGGSSSGKSYWKLYEKDIVIELLVKEIEIIKPKYIILCDRYFEKFLTVENAARFVGKDSALEKCIKNGRFFVAYHPAARMSKEKMLDKLENQLI